MMGFPLSFLTPRELAINDPLAAAPKLCFELADEAMFRPIGIIDAVAPDAVG